MGPAAALQNSLWSQTDHFFKQRQVRCSPTSSPSRYKALSGAAYLLSRRLAKYRFQAAVSGIAKLPLKAFTSRGYRPVSRPLSQHKLRATVKEEAYQEVHDYVVLFKVPQCSDWYHTNCSVAGVASNAICLYGIPTRHMIQHSICCCSVYRLRGLAM